MTIALLASLLISQSPVESQQSVRQFFDTGLISVASVGWQTTLRQGDRSFTLTDDDWGIAFALVPEAQKVARSLRESYDFGMTMVRVGVGIELAGLVGASGLLLTALAIGTAVLPVATIVALALVCAGLAVVGAIVALVGVPALTRAQTGTLELVSDFNHGLARAPVPEPGLVIPLGP